MSESHAPPLANSDAVQISILASNTDNLRNNHNTTRNDGQRNKEEDKEEEEEADFDPLSEQPTNKVVRSLHAATHFVLRVCVFVPFSLLYFVVFLLLWPVRLIETQLHRRRDIGWERMFLFRFNQQCARFFLGLLGIKVDVRGSWPLPSDGPMIITFNHASALDGVVIGAYLPLPHLVIAKAELRWYPVINLLFYVYGTVFVPRAKRSQAIQALRQASHRIAADRRCIIISPEGTRSRNGLLQAFKKGPFYLARESRIPVLPIAIRGLYRLCPRDCLYPRPGRVILVCGAPISSNDREIEQRCGIKAPAGLEGEAFFRAHLAMDLWDELKGLLREKTDENMHLRPKYEGAENEEARPIHVVSVSPVEAHVLEQKEDPKACSSNQGGSLEPVGEDEVTPLPGRASLGQVEISDEKTEARKHRSRHHSGTVAAAATEPSEQSAKPPLKKTAFVDEQQKKPQRNRAMSFIF